MNKPELNSDVIILVAMHDGRELEMSARFKKNGLFGRGFFNATKCSLFRQSDGTWSNQDGDKLIHWVYGQSRNGPFAPE